MKKIIKVNKIDDNLRLDKWLKLQYSALQQSYVEKNLRKKNILVNNQKKQSSYRVVIGDEIKILNYNKEVYKNKILVKISKTIPKKLKEYFISAIIYENKDFIVLNKWAGISTQGGSKIKYCVDDLIKDISPSYNLVHRLDKETSGLLIIAKNLNFTKLFGSLFKNQEIEKKYIGICQGSPKNLQSNIDLEISDTKKKNLKQKTQTYYKVLNTKNHISQILFYPKTGKKHQIRIVCKNLGCPIIGDLKYNNQSKFKNEKLKLHAFNLRFTIMNKKYNFYSDLPDHFNEFFKINKLKNIKLNKY